MDKPRSEPIGSESTSIFEQAIGRRALLKGAGALGVAGLTAPMLSAVQALASGSRPSFTF